MGSSSSKPSTPPPAPPPSYVVKAKVDADLVQTQGNCADFDAEELHDVLVTRRGMTFPIQLRTSKGARLGSVDSTTLVYAYNEDKKVVLELVSFDIRGYGADLQVKIPANAPVTAYVLNIKGSFDNGEKYEVDLERDVVVLFNAWSKDDQVYLEDESWRQEYVLNSKGRLYIGDLRGNAWNLGLYRPNTFRAVLYICENLSKLTFEQKSDPVMVAREISALVNVQDENGVLMGRWDGQYSDGKKPSFWTGSGAILEQFYKSGGEPVKYGQCWVFSGVLLSVLRVLGLPSRSVTNFSSAHDTNRNRTIDKYYTSDGESIDYLRTGSDSIWNFHVWNETWMFRPDLPAGYGGWQVLDATPQEESPQGGGYKTGPCSLEAIKNGNSLNYDTNFVIAEVNADIKTFVLDADGVPQLYSVDTNTVGKTISTKSVGSWQREDITHLYKYPEGSGKERGALYHKYKELQDEVHDVEFTVLEADYEFGKDIVFKVKAFNKGKQRHVRGRIICQAVTYTGRILGHIDTLRVDVNVNQGTEAIVTMTVDSEAFTKFIGTKVFLKFRVALTVVGTSHLFNRTVSLTPQRPNLSISGEGQVAVGEETKLLFSFENPLPVDMKDVTLNIDVDGMKDDDVVQNIGTIKAHGHMKYVLEITGVKLGTHSIVASLASDKVEHVSGEHEIDVLKSVPPKIPVELDMLEIKEVDLNKSSNSSAHHTENYAYPGLVVRRGQNFTITVTTTRPLPTGSEVVTAASFQMVSRYLSKHTFHLDTISSSVQGDTITLELKPPADTSIGEYTLVLTVDDNGIVNVLHQEIRVVILFNPWCTDDSCHYPTTADLDEYVLNTRGKIWVGNANSNYGRPWQFSQFNKDSLEVALWIMDRMIAKERDNPVLVSRFISAATNVQGDNGILVGNWSGDYSDGTSPLKWTGSGAILAEFNKTKSPVSYGQCWVFSGVQTTLLRCLGLPARSITNFNSAHDTNFNRAIDKFYDEDGNPETSEDSIWNFHVWNEAWMARPDISVGFGGWQILDATPQEESPQGGGYLLGPASCRAIKLGQRMNYDVEFVISEVNADVRSYTVHKDGSQTLSGVNTFHVGKSISTKAIGSSRREDVTSNYKFEEGSSAERAALLVETESEELISASIEVDHNVLVGEDFTVNATVTNKASSPRSLKVQLYGRAVLYTGAAGQIVKQISATDYFKVGETKEYELHVTYKDYLRILQGGNFINIVCMVYDQKNKKSLIKFENLRLKTPDITIELPKEGLKLYQSAEINVSFKNPLQRVLTEGKLELHGDGYVKDTIMEISQVYPHHIAKAVLKTIPVKLGTFQLQVVFSSAQLTDVMGDDDVTVVVA